MALDENDLAKIGELIGQAVEGMKKETTKQVNGAIANVKDTFGKKLEGVLDAEAVAALATEKAQAIAADLAKKSAPAGDKSQGQGQLDPETKRMLDEMKAANEALQAKVRKGEEERAKERAERHAMEEKQAITAELAKVGVRDGLRGAALAYIREKGMVKRDGEGNIVFERPSDVGGVERLSLSDGFADWAKSTEGKEFLPQRDVRGSGDTQPARGAANGQQGTYVPLTGQQMAEIIRQSSME